ERVAKRCRHAGELSEYIVADRTEKRRSDHHRDAAKTEQDPGELAGGELFIAGEEMRDHYAPNGRGRVEDRGQSAGDMGLTPSEQDEGNGVVEQGEDEDRAPDLSRKSRGFTAPPQEQPHGHGRHGEPQPD